MLLVIILGVLALRVAALQQVVYWGQAGTQPPLRFFCHPSQGIDIIPIAFIYNFGNTVASGADWLPGGTFGPCDMTDPWTPSSECLELGKDIAYCQSQGKQVLVSLGGGAGDYEVTGVPESQDIASQLFGMLGPPGQGAFPRPFGDVSVDGFDLDIEDGGDVEAYASMVRRFQSLYRMYEPRPGGLPDFIVSGAPQCVVPDANLGDAIFNATFDKLFIQFYNTPECSARGFISGYGGPYGGNFTFDEWKNWVQQPGSKSKEAQLYIGLPAATSAANLDNLGRPYWLEPSEALQLVNDFRNDSSFAGIMLWDAEREYETVISGCTYSQQIASILKSGALCSK